MSNLFLLHESTDYFANSTELNVFAHTWSLGGEEQFYFLFPFLVWFTGFGRLLAKGSRDLFRTVGTLISVLLIGFIRLYHTNQPAAYSLMPIHYGSWALDASCLSP
jgi:peptidoglycan/LPS O-acetylase OafA/YrhL